ncbi:MAG: Card1-like endonuclease domain-containing protein, partial [Anaerolineae bacterium]
FLLIGENPLPNWVAAQLLVAPGGTLYLVYSDVTDKIAERLCERLGSDTQLVRVNPTDARDIYDTVRRCVSKLQGTVGLHYTGGTKAMAVHAYRAVEAALQGGSRSAVFSYLDAEAFLLRIDPDWQEHVLFEVQPKLEDLAALHGARLRKGSPQRSSHLWAVDTATALAQSMARGGWTAWQAWFGQLCNAIRSHPVSGAPLPADPPLSNVRKAMCQDLGLPAHATELPPAIVDSLRPRIKWFGGEWLEHYVLAQLREIAAITKLHDCGMSLATNQRPGRSDFDFEFDVAAMRGYQFFGLSCTTSQEKNTAKQKLFEAYTRARQLGGDEARVGLVCGYDDVYRFEKEVLQEWRAKGKIKVFGPRDWPDLASRLEAWLETAQ